MAIRAWLFDLGNTLMSIPSEYDEELCIQRILAIADVDEVRSLIYALCDRYVGQSAEQFLARFDAAVNGTCNRQITVQLRDAWENSVAAAILKPGAHEILDELRRKGMLLGLVSNTPPTSREILDRLELRDRFDAIILSCDVGFLKPDPRIFRAALDKLDVNARDAVIVGDKIRTDILGGAILGMRSVLVEERLRQVVENNRNYVDAIVPRLESLRETILFRSLP